MLGFSSLSNLATNAYIGYIVYKGFQARDLDPSKLKETGKAILYAVVCAPLDFAATLYAPVYARDIAQSVYRTIFTIPPIYAIYERGDYLYWENFCMNWGEAWGGPILKAGVAMGGLCTLYCAEKLAFYLGQKAYDYCYSETQVKNDPTRSMIFSNKDAAHTAMPQRELLLAHNKIL